MNLHMEWNMKIFDSELTEEEMSFIVYNLAGVNRSQEITLENYDKIVAAFSNAVHGKVIPEENSEK